MEAANHPDSRCVIVVDADRARASEVAGASGAKSEADWHAVVEQADVDVVIAATPNGLLCEIATAALTAGKHVLIEKPMGRNLAEAEQMRASAIRAGKLLKVGFNHRYHPAIVEMKRRFDDGQVGLAINVRCRYGHGGRPGYEREWRGNRELAGGGELTDQGVHVIDLFQWFLHLPTNAFAWLQTAIWPLGDLEDNGFGMFRYQSGVVASFHTSWTQWKNLFSLELFGTEGALVVEGLGRSYGTETLTTYRRNPAGGAPATDVMRYEGDDTSWRDEWAEMVNAISLGTPMNGTADDGVAAMRMLDALYRSAAAGQPVGL